MRDPVNPQVQQPVTFGILGPFQARLNDGQVLIKATKQRALLAALVLRANRPVTVETLTALLWDGSSPPGARGTVQAYVMRLRGALGAPGRRVLQTVAGGYQLSVPPDAVDLARFEKLTDQAERSAAAGQLAVASRELGQALALWRGPALADIDSEVLRRTEVPRLDEQRMLVIERRIELDLALGRHRQVIAEVRELVSRYPLRERYWYLLMQALHRSGWRADALATYRAARDVITRELGVEPGEPLQELHKIILNGGHGSAGAEAAGRHGLGNDGAVADQAGPDGVTGEGGTGDGASCNGASRDGASRGRAGRPGPAGLPGAWAGQCQLPREIPDFVGRSADTGQIAAMLASRDGVPVVVLCGPPGAGKTALAVRVAHRIRREFPDGQFYVPLAGGGVREPGLVMASLLAATGVAASAIPGELSALSAAFRARLADRRVLLVLDGARAADQVRPLLPGTAGCAVLVTSHSELRSLCALGGARRHTLGPLPAAQSRRLLALLTGQQRVAGERAAADRIAARCGHLPLALRIAGTILACRPGQPLRDYADELDGTGLLDKLALGDDGAAAVRTVLGQCYDELGPGLRQRFTTLAALCEPHVSDISVGSAAAKLGLPGEEAATLLDALAERSLLLPAGPGRYRFAPLLGTFAAEKALASKGASA